MYSPAALVIVARHMDFDCVLAPPGSSWLARLMCGSPPPWQWGCSGELCSQRWALGFRHTVWTCGLYGSKLSDSYVLKILLIIICCIITMSSHKIMCVKCYIRCSSELRCASATLPARLETILIEWCMLPSSVLNEYCMPKRNPKPFIWVHWFLQPCISWIQFPIDQSVVASTVSKISDTKLLKVRLSVSTANTDSYRQAVPGQERHTLMVHVWLNCKVLGELMWNIRRLNQVRTYLGIILIRLIFPDSLTYTFM